MKRKQLFIAFAALTAPASFLSAQLAFEKQATELDAHFDAETVEQTFVFRNTGEVAVTIEDISSSCECTTAESDKTTYEPGERGEIKGVFTVGDRIGTRIKTFRVRTDEEEHPVYILRMEVYIPQVLTVTPRVLYWERGGDIRSRAVRVAFHPDAGYELIGATSGGGDFELEIVEGSEAHEYEVRVTPHSLEEERYTGITLETDPDAGSREAFTFYVHVR